MSELWICLIILHVLQDFENALGSKCARVLNMAWLYMQELHRLLDMSEYGSICLNNASVCFNIAEYSWMPLNIPENAWINCSDYAFGRCSSTLAELIPLLHSGDMSILYSNSLHDSDTIPRCKGVYVNSFFPCTARHWNSQHAEPLTNDLNC